jgi:cation transport ATPase
VHVQHRGKRTTAKRQQQFTKKEQLNFTSKQATTHTHTHTQTANKMVALQVSDAQSQHQQRDQTDQVQEWTVMFREWRHNRCLMTPVAAIVIFAMALSSLVALLLSFPQFLLGLFLVSYICH